MQEEDMTNMLEGIVSGKLNKLDLDKQIQSMEDAVDNMGTLPPGVDKKDPNSMALNSDIFKEEIPGIETGIGSSRTLLEKIAQKLFRGCMANKVLQGQPSNVVYQL